MSIITDLLSSVKCCAIIDSISRGRRLIGFYSEIEETHWLGVRQEDGCMTRHGRVCVAFIHLGGGPTRFFVERYNFVKYSRNLGVVDWCEIFEKGLLLQLLR